MCADRREGSDLFSICLRMRIQAVSDLMLLQVYAERRQQGLF
jgi:hypothetical protein